MKAVNTKVCSVSARGGNLLAEKIEYFRQLLSGKKVAAGQQVHVSVKDHPQAALWCTNYLAKKLAVSRK